MLPSSRLLMMQASPMCVYLIARAEACIHAVMPHTQMMDGDCAGLIDLPWNRVGVWAVVVWFMYSLKDFFGVSRSVTSFFLDQQSRMYKRCAIDVCPIQDYT